MPIPPNDEWIAADQCRRILKTFSYAILKLALQGKIRYQNLPSGSIRYNRADVEALAKQMGIE